MSPPNAAGLLAFDVPARPAVCGGEPETSAGRETPASALRAEAQPSPRGKRALDVAASVVLLGGLVVVGPLVVAAVRLTSRGPALYRQERLGLGGVPFSMFKFRTMRHSDAPEEARWATENDPRVTPVGRLLRKTRLDELPQVLNILRGEMSLVGPRPEQPAIAARLAAAIPGYARRLAVRPGLTGWAQVHHGYDQTLDDVRIKLRYDLDYVARASVGFDLRILVRTVRVVLGMHGR